MRPSKAEKRVILKCLKRAWNCADDRPLFEQEERDQENIRLDLIKRLTKELKL